MKCKACNGEMAVSWRYVEEIDRAILEELCPVCLGIVRSSLVPWANPFEAAPISFIELGIHIEHDYVTGVAQALRERTMKDEGDDDEAPSTSET